MVSSTRKTILCLVIAAILAALTQAASVELTDNNDNNANMADLSSSDSGNSERVRRDIRSLSAQLEQMMRYMAALFQSGSSPFTLIQRMRNIPFPQPSSSRDSNRTPYNKQPKAMAQSQHRVVEAPRATTCNPPCKTGRECCLRPPGAAVASCQRTRLSGNTCGWDHYTSSNPKTVTALQKPMCPCMVGMGCVSATPSKPGVCTFF